MVTMELTVRSADGDFIGRLYFEDGQIGFSDDTRKSFIEAVIYQIEHDDHVVFSNGERIVTKPLYGHDEKTLEVLSEFLRFSMNYETKLRSVVSASEFADMIKYCKDKHHEERCSERLFNVAGDSHWSGVGTYVPSPNSKFLSQCLEAA